MGKITEIKFVGQPIFIQIINLVDKAGIQGLINKHHRLLLQIVQNTDAPSYDAVRDIKPV
jgi:hypothetical protein